MEPWAEQDTVESRVQLSAGRRQKKKDTNWTFTETPEMPPQE